MNYLICSTQRSGSSFLCHLLKGTGILGKPTELFGKKGACEKVASKHGIKGNAADVARFVEKKWRSHPTGVFGLKMHYHQYMSFLEQEELSGIIGNFDYIYIDRKDVVAQAVSLYRARRTGAWSSQHESNKDFLYDYDGIKDALYFLCKEKALWESFFASIDQKPLRIMYEDLEHDPDSEINRVVEFLGVSSFERAEKKEGLYLEKQRDELSDEYKVRFIADSKKFVFNLY